MVTTTLSTPPTVPRTSLRATRKTNKVHDDNEEEEWQKKRELSLNNTSTRLDLGGSHRSRGSVTVTPNKSSGKDPRNDTAADLKVVGSKSGNDGYVRCETLASDAEKVETSAASRNPGKMKVDPAFEDLSWTAQEFLRKKGITSALNLMAKNANELAPAWIEWNKEGAFKSINKATSDVQCWKRKVRDRWYSSSTKKEATPRLVPRINQSESDVSEFLNSQDIASAEAFLSTKTETMANALIQWKERTRKETLAFIPARELIYRWKRKSREQEASLCIQPLEKQGAGLKTLSRMARRFLSSQGISSAEAFLSTNTTATANALVDWRMRTDSSECSTLMARQRICCWKRRLRERQSNLQEASRVLDPESDVLSSIISDWQQALQEHIAGSEQIYVALSRSATPSVVSGSPNDSRSLQPEESPRLGTGNTATQGGTKQIRIEADETALGAAAATPVSQVSVQTEQASPPMRGTIRRKVAARTFLSRLPAEANETGMDKTMKDENTSNDSFSYHHGDSKAAEPRDDTNKRKPDSKRKRSQDESSPQKYRYRVFWV
jgi:hypothetical protein